MNEKDIARFWSRVDKTPGHGPKGDCWIWTGAPNRGGYGFFSYAGKNRPAHRVAWEIENGPIPEGMIVRHECDNPPCVRHLLIGTHADNARDMWERGRQGGPVADLAEQTHCLRGHPLTPDNLTTVGRRVGQRICRICHRLRNAEFKKRKRSARRIAGVPMAALTPAQCNALEQMRNGPARVDGRPLTALVRKGLAVRKGRMEITPAGKLTLAGATDLGRQVQALLQEERS